MSDAATAASPRRHPLGTVATALVVVVAVVAGAAVYAWGRGSSGASSAHTITVTGSGSVMGTPNTATVQLGVQITAPTAVAALNRDNARVAALIKALEAQGIPKKDLQTSGLNLWDNTNSSGAIVSFSVSNQLTVTIHHLATAGAAIDAAATAVGNGIQLNGITLSISHDSALLTQARERAIRNARAAAAEIATAGGASLGGLVSVVDLENQSTEILPVFAATPTAANELRSVPVEAGTQSISVQVRAVFAL